MPSVRYVGPFSPVRLPTLGIEVYPGDVFDVADDGYTHDSLCAQHDFQDASEPVIEPERLAAIVREPVEDGWQAPPPAEEDPPAEPVAPVENGATE